MFRRPTVTVADDRSVFSELVAESLRAEFDVVDVAHDVRGAIANVERFKPDVVVLDVAMPMLTAIEAAARIGEIAPSAVVVFVALKRNCASSTTTARCGALGFLLRTSQIADIAEAIWTLLDGTADTMRGMGEAHLTTREKEVVQLLAEGKLMKQVADMLHVSPRTVAFHKYGVMRKLGLRSSAELVRLAVSKGLVA